jgi:hypothetical protein
MDKAFWQAILENNCTVPEGHTVASLTPELLAYLGSTDPELRDDIALSILATWIERAGGYTNDELRTIGKQMAHNLTLGIGEQGSDAVFLRSFSALVLDCVIEHDNTQPFLEPAEIQSYLEQALDYLTQERDLRGYVAEKGWAHSAAHTADLLGYMARSHALDAGDLERILHAIATKMIAPVEHVYLYKEDERLAYTVMTILRRDLIGLPFLEAWVDQLASADDPTTWYQAASTEAGACARHNAKVFLRSLYFQLAWAENPPQVAPELIAKLSAALKTIEQVFYRLP